jgi:hypothetical protein
MEKEKITPLTSLMRPALCEAYVSAQKVFEENEYAPTIRVEYFPNGNIRFISFEGLTKEIVEKVSDAMWNVKISRDEKNLDRQKDILGFTWSLPLSDSLTNSAYLQIG